MTTTETLTPIKKICPRGKRREAIADVIRTSFSCPASASQSKRLDLLVEYHNEHPEYPINLLATTCGVSLTGLYRRIVPAKRTLPNKFEVHREEIRRTLQQLMDNDWIHRPRPPSIRFAKRQLNTLGISAGFREVRAILLGLGYDYRLNTLG